MGNIPNCGRVPIGSNGSGAMRKCEACGTTENVYGSLGGVMLCKAHHADISDQIGTLREQGKPVDVTRIARRMYRELHPDENLITPHKGGRTARFPDTRLTPEVRAKLDEILARLNISAADWVTEKVNQDSQ